ncbi:LicD family protein [Paracoccaceae bacterium]|jgi:phosphorylcholine metabolism protein LicD|nr:LicD family protein [Paracoccaceae bacterium]|tara:strand:- start:82 stop:672 length:591 start_codon:yes stop_codon:yes gene_type:complete
MIDPVPIKLNLNNLRDVFSRISHLEAFIFFGTLLGYQREGNIIPFDDDVDIYVNVNEYDQLLTALEGSGFKIEVKPRKRWYQRLRKPLFVQATRFQDGIKTFVDFYLYNDSSCDYLVDKWNFLGNWKDVKSAIHVPKNLVFPLITVSMQGINIRIPAKSEAMCTFLYGPCWKIPVRKGEDYFMEIINHTPVFRKKQ